MCHHISKVKHVLSHKESAQWTVDVTFSKFNRGWSGSLVRKYLSYILQSFKEDSTQYAMILSDPSRIPIGRINKIHKIMSTCLVPVNTEKPSSWMGHNRRSGGSRQLDLSIKNPYNTKWTKNLKIVSTQKTSTLNFEFFCSFFLSMDSL